MVSKIKLKIGLILVLTIVASLIFVAYRGSLIKDIGKCGADSECLIVQVDSCSPAEAISKSNLNLWNSSIKKRDLVCNPPINISNYRSRCINHRCNAVPLQ